MSEINFRNKLIKHEGRPEFWESLPLEGWEPETFNVLDKILGPGKVFLDIGAWNGVLSIYASLLGAKCYAYEPDPVAFIELTKNVGLNGVDVQIHQMAVAMSGSFRLKSESFGNSMSSLVAPDGKDVAMVSSTTLRKVVEAIESPDLIKIDTEGAEAVIIPYAIDTLKEVNCPLLLSLHPHVLSNDDIKTVWDSLEKIYDMGKTETMPNNQYFFQK